MWTLTPITFVWMHADRKFDISGTNSNRTCLSLSVRLLKNYVFVYLCIYVLNHLTVKCRWSAKNWKYFFFFIPFDSHWSRCDFSGQDSISPSFDFLKTGRPHSQPKLLECQSNRCKLLLINFLEKVISSWVWMGLASDSWDDDLLPGHSEMVRGKGLCLCNFQSYLILHVSRDFCGILCSSFSWKCQELEFKRSAKSFPFDIGCWISI